MILLDSFMLTLTRIDDKLTLSSLLLVTIQLLNPGELVAPFLVFLEFLEVVPTVLVKELSETCVEEDACSLQPRSGEDGTDE